jgi:hypothetical protein
LKEGNMYLIEKDDSFDGEEIEQVIDRLEWWEKCIERMSVGISQRRYIYGEAWRKKEFWE